MRWTMRWAATVDKQGNQGPIRENVWLMTAKKKTKGVGREKDPHGRRAQRWRYVDQGSHKLSPGLARTASGREKKINHEVSILAQIEGDRCATGNLRLKTR